ncbi:hypothetical protein NW733_01745 [Mycoplasmopsis felis]|nr:hypothetical protein [Mycoplasmopsis felis]MCU9931450.1 hypothetical protein [Mycoplasmopsis felis]
MLYFFIKSFNQFVSLSPRLKIALFLTLSKQFDVSPENLATLNIVSSFSASPKQIVLFKSKLYSLDNQVNELPFDALIP